MNKRNILRKIAHGPFEPIFSIAFKIISNLEILYFNIKWFIMGERKPNQKEIDLVVQNVTFIFKSFERQNMAKQLYKNIQKYYPGVRVIIADDSKKTLEIKGSNLKIIHLPFNSGLSKGLNAALKEVKTPFVMRMDDDELLTPLSKVEKELLFLMEHQEIDLVGFMPLSTIMCKPVKEVAKDYYRQPLFYAPKRLKIPHLTVIDNEHIVVAKPANIFLARSHKIKEIGWDNNIRMIDHNEFFVRAAGNIVSVLNPTSVIFHYHNQFNKYYQKYRGDVQGDREYIANKIYKI